MSNTFAERFKGRIEEFHKQGIQQIISSSSNPANNQKGNRDMFFYSEKIENHDNQRFSKNAQTNILDFQKNYQTMIKKDQFATPNYDNDFYNQRNRRPVYSALDEIKQYSSNNLNQYYSELNTVYNKIDMNPNDFANSKNQSKNVSFSEVI